MKNFKTDRLKFIIASVLAALTFCFQSAQAQENETISIYQYRKVDDDKVNEFIEREIKYWSKVAQKAIDDGKLGFWGLFQKVGGYNIPNSSNFLFVNTFQDLPDMDEMAGIWDVAAVFTDVPVEDMETYSMGINTSMIFVKPIGWTEAEGINLEEDFKYVNMVYQPSFVPQGINRIGMCCFQSL